MLFQLLNNRLTLESAITQIIALLFIIFLVLPIHEFAHAGVAYLMGDKGIKYRGRLTFNPLSHVDPFGALCLLLFGFGWAKPVPVDHSYFKKPKFGMTLTALAGPVSNILCAMLAGLSIRLLVVFNPSDIALFNGQILYNPSMNQGLYYLLQFLAFFLSVNVTLAVFNLIPLPPLDGSKVLFSFLPDKALAFMNTISRYSFIIIYAVIIMFTRTGLYSDIVNFFIKICMFQF